MKLFKHLRQSIQEKADICPVCDHDPCICETGQHVSEMADMCNVCGQTPCNCTHIDESQTALRKLHALQVQAKNSDYALVHKTAGKTLSTHSTQSDAHEAWKNLEHSQRPFFKIVQQPRKVQEDSEQLDEISYKATQDYRQAAHSQIQHYKHAGGRGKPEAAKVLAKREKGMATATAKVIAHHNAIKASAPKVAPPMAEPYKPLGGRDEKSGRSYSEEYVAEGSEQIDEISKETLLNYAKKVSDSRVQQKRSLQQRSRSIKGEVGVHKRLDKAYEELEDNGQGVAEESELGDLAHQKTLKHRFLVTYTDPNHTSVSMRKEKQQKHILAPSVDKHGSSVYIGDAEPLVKKHMKKQGYKVHEIEHVGMVSKRVNT